MTVQLYGRFIVNLLPLSLLFLVLHLFLLATSHLIFRYLFSKVSILCPGINKLNTKLKFIKVKYKVYYLKLSLLKLALKNGFPVKMIVKLLNCKQNPVGILSNQNKQMLVSINYI